MSKTTDSSLFMFTPFARYAAGFYQQLLRSTGSYEEFCNRLILLGEQAHLFREFNKVIEVGLLLSNLPVKRYQAIGYYFLAVASSCGGNGDQDKAARLFELAVDTAPDSYKVKALVSLGTLAIRRNDLDSASRYFRETIRTERLGPMSLQATRGMSILKSIEAFHRSAITDIERILPVIGTAPPRVRLDCLNSYAVELSEVGRLQEAESVSLLVIASPLARYYPQWQETLLDVRSKRKRRSTVTISRPLIEQEDEAETVEPVTNVPQFRLEQSVPEPRAQTVINFMSSNVHRRVSLSELGSVVNLSASHFSRIFKSETGVSPGEYLIRLRMEKARHLLATSFLSIKEIMAQVSYGNRKDFVGHFKRYFGLTPSEYRRRHRRPVTF